jgi:coenzyme F420-0:L-glutamate ligase/coenzyme F420-1:gamma-L-glutamate ligase
VAVVRGLHPVDDGSTARDLVRPVEDDLFSLGTEEALAQGRREALLLPRDVRDFGDEPVDEAALRRAVGVALAVSDAPVRFGWLRDQARRRASLDAIGAEHEPPELLVVLGDGSPGAAAAVQALLVALAAEGLGVHWTAADTAAGVDVPPGLLPLGSVAVGVPAEPLRPFSPDDPAAGLLEW